MKKNKPIYQRYFDWICRLIEDHCPAELEQYSRLLRFLSGVQFEYYIERDGNREADGMDLRYRFGSETACADAEIASTLDTRPCSVLEMMAALSLRCEEHIMADYNVGNRCGRWFWKMVQNLGLAHMTDDRFDQREAERVVFTFLNRRYERNGKGGLFVCRTPVRDMRSMEIWYQMCEYLREYLNEEAS